MSLEAEPGGIVMLFGIRAWWVAWPPRRSATPIEEGAAPWTPRTPSHAAPACPRT